MIWDNPDTRDGKLERERSKVCAACQARSRVSCRPKAMTSDMTDWWDGPTSEVDRSRGLPVPCRKLRATLPGVRTTGNDGVASTERRGGLARSHRTKSWLEEDLTTMTMTHCLQWTRGRMAHRSSSPAQSSPALQTTPPESQCNKHKYKRRGYPPQRWEYLIAPTQTQVCF